jgi:hypothetical protein
MLLYNWARQASTLEEKHPHTLSLEGSSNTVMCGTRSGFQNICNYNTTTTKSAIWYHKQDEKKKEAF